MRRVTLKFQIIDPDQPEWAIMGEASTTVEVRTDLLSAAFTDGAQDWYSAMVGALGTMAYMDAFPKM